MAVAENGRVVHDQKDKVNGVVAGHHTSSRRKLRSRKTWTAWTVNNVARLTVSYALIIILFWCPSDPKELSASSPQVCRPYHLAKTAVQPYVRPYYDSYATPYIEKVRPYYEQANTQFITPASIVAAKNYRKFAVPQIEKANSYARAQWSQYVRPQLGVAQERASTIYAANIEPHVSQASSLASPYYTAARDSVVNIQNKHVIPAVVYSKPLVQNFYTATHTFLLGTAIPYAQYGWSHFAIFMEGTLWPFMKNLYSNNVRPQLVLISERIAKYQEGRKLQNLMDSADQSLSASGYTITTVESDKPLPSSAGVTDSLSSFVASIVEEASTVADAVTSSISPQQTRKVEHATEESISEDLVKWQQKFAIAADKGTEDLRERVADLVNDLVKSDIDHEGRGLADALDKTTEVELEKVKAKIKAVVGSLPDDVSAADEDAASDEIVGAVRESGTRIRARAVKLRDWAQTFETTIDQRTKLAATTTLQVLDSIRDLGLQEIGMRWAWMEGVTYKHWQKYHDLRQRFDEWRSEVQDVAVNHQAAQSAKQLAETILEESMAITEAAAKELFRLKDVAKWKIRAKDSTNNFEDRIIPAAAVSVASKVAEEVKEFTSSIIGTSQGTFESIASQATEAAADFGSAASSVVADSVDGVQAIISDAASAAAVTASSVSSVVAGGGFTSLDHATREAAASLSSASEAILGKSSGTAESIVYDALSSISAAIIGSSTGSVESLVSEASSKASSILQGTDSGVIDSIVAKASSAIIGSSDAPLDVAASASNLAQSAAHSASSIASHVTESASAIANDDVFSKAEHEVNAIFAGLEDLLNFNADPTSTACSTKATPRFFPGAMAQEVRGQIPILDDVFDDDFSAHFSEQVQSMASQAGEQYTDITKAISEAFYGTPQGTAASLTSLAREQYLSALTAASSALYGTHTPIAEKVVGDVTNRYKLAVAAASSVLFASTPTPLTDSIVSNLDSAFKDATRRAEDFRSAAVEVVSKQMSGTPKPIHSQMIASISSAYADSVAKASDRLSSALKAASSQYSSISGVAASALPTPGAIESVSSVAALRLREALDAASSQYHNAKVAVGAEAPPLTLQAQQNYYAAIGYAHDQYSSFLAAGSSAIYGTPTPVYQQLLSQASSQFAQASAAASSNLNAYLSSVSSVANKASMTKGPASSILEQASASYSSALSAASASLSSASSQASIAVYGTTPAAYKRAAASIKSEYSDITKFASIYMNNLLQSASSAKKSPVQSVFDGISSQYETAVAAASSSMSAALSSASSALYGPEDGSLESLASAASQNWDSLVSQASEKIYGQPTPVWASLTSQAGEYSAQATDIAAEKFVVIQHFVSELIIGKEPDFTDSVMSRLSSAYYTGIAASASSLASEAYASGSSIASSISSAASEYFVSPPEINSILDRINSQLNEVVDAASLQVYGSQKGPVERATSAAGEAYASVSSAASQAVYGSSLGYGEAAGNSIAAAAQQASEALSLAIWGTPTGHLESASSAAASQYDAISSVLSSSLSEASEKAASVANVAKSKVSEALYGPEQNAFDSAQAKIFEAVESAKSKIAEFGGHASTGAVHAASVVSESIESIASAVSESVSSVTERVKDEL